MPNEQSQLLIEFEPTVFQGMIIWIPEQLFT